MDSRSLAPFSYLEWCECQGSVGQIFYVLGLRNRCSFNRSRLANPDSWGHAAHHIARPFDVELVKEELELLLQYFADLGLATPRTEGVLPGISQEFLFELASRLGIERFEQDITPQQLLAADEVFLTSTSVCILPVVRVDDAVIGSGAPGPVYKELLGAWSESVGVDIAGQARQFSRR